MRTGRKAIIALLLAMLLALPLAGSSLAKPLISEDMVDVFGDEDLDILDTLDDRAEDEGRTPTHGWYVSQFADGLDEFLDELELDEDDEYLLDLNRGKWISAFSHWVKTQGDWANAIEARAEAKAAKKEAQEERRQARLEADVEDDDDDIDDDDANDDADDDDDDEPGGGNAFGHGKKAAATTDRVNNGQAKKAGN